MSESDAVPDQLAGREGRNLASRAPVRTQRCLTSARQTGDRASLGRRGAPARSAHAWARCRYRPEPVASDATRGGSVSTRVAGGADTARREVRPGPEDVSGDTSPLAVDVAEEVATGFPPARMVSATRDQHPLA